MNRAALLVAVLSAACTLAGCSDADRQPTTQPAQSDQADPNRDAAIPAGQTVQANGRTFLLLDQPGDLPGGVRAGLDRQANHTVLLAMRDALVLSVTDVRFERLLAADVTGNGAEDIVPILHSEQLADPTGFREIALAWPDSDESVVCSPRPSPGAFRVGADGSLTALFETMAIAHGIIGDPYIQRHVWADLYGIGRPVHGLLCERIAPTMEHPITKEVIPLTSRLAGYWAPAGDAASLRFVECSIAIPDQGRPIPDSLRGLLPPPEPTRTNPD